MHISNEMSGQILLSAETLCRINYAQSFFNTWIETFLKLYFIEGEQN